MSIRKDFIDFTSSFSGSLPLDVLCSLTGQDFIIPFYHIVGNEECPHLKYLYSFKDTKEFEKDIDYLAKHYQPVGADALPDILAGKYKGKKIMLLTFDDGLRQMHEVVAPLLIKKGIPAVFFLNTDFIDNKALMFRYKISLALSNDYDKYYNLSYTQVRNDADINEHLITTLEGGRNGFNTIVNEFLQHYKPYMSSAQIRSLISQGFTIGAHSCNHPYYEDLTLEQQLSQTFDCLGILQKDFGIKEKLFAFPFTDHGVSKTFFDKMFEHGKMDFSFGGAGIKKDIHPRQFQRVPMEGWNASAEQILKSEYLYYLLRAPFFKNKIKRDELGK